MAGRVALAVDPPAVQWTRVFHGYGGASGNYLEQTADKGYVVVGGTSSDSRHSDCYAVKVDSLGNPEWEREFGDSLPADDASAIQQLPDQGYALFGLSTDSTLVEKFLLLIRADSLGNQLWKQSYTQDSSQWGYFGQATSDGGFVLAGIDLHNMAGDTSTFVVKCDSAGVEQWRRWLPRKNLKYGGNGYSPIRQTHDGGYVLASSTTTGVLVTKTTASGSITWNKTYDTLDLREAFDVVETQDHGFAATGYSCAEGPYYPNVCLLKTDSAGNLQWAKSYGGDGEDYGCSVRQTSDSGYVIAGVTGSGPAPTYAEDGHILRTDKNGTLLWEKTFGSETRHDEAYCAIQTSDGGFAVTGALRDTTGSGWSGLYLMKLAPEANR